MCRSNTCRAHKRYRKKASQSAEDIDVDGSVVTPGNPRDQLTISFGTGEVTGVFVRDRLCIGEPSQEMSEEMSEEGRIRGNALLQVDKGHLSQMKEAPVEDDSGREQEGGGCSFARIVIATQMTDDPFGSFAFDGVFGLGLPRLSQSPEFNVFSTASSTMAWLSALPSSQRIFSLFLGVADDEESEITFGGFRQEHLKPDASFAWHEVLEPELGHWQVEVREIRANGQRLDFCDDGSCRAVIDTGTSLLGVPSSLGPLLTDLLQHEASPELACAGPGYLLEIDLGNITVTLRPEDYARPEFTIDGSYRGGPDGLAPKAAGEVDLTGRGEDPSVAFASLPAGHQQMCVPMLLHIDMPEPLHSKTLILGEPVLQVYYTAFDMDPIAPRIGLAEARHLKSRSPLRVFL
eukprot:CAMPEP_0170617954 /NCGR_PEP_ID=MMETSP0224-20130122/26699_1 /TAXON_ID=285029 /ORGANISM="Togula jolla, Strain CCCM 725" /LENGTH=404 /DNA_ID=CAMNT_0010943893 /DNA_START=400 /DNA_END=1614 /DNA_ORIENTATION=-